MKVNSIKVLSVLSALLIALSSCNIVEGIFKAGIWVGILFVAGIIALVIFLISKFR
ncbi:MAG: phosphatidate cytidylyltransferase [Chitinophagaceae bacterium]|nr:phosphatidate cytidylyltransferase [Chitinophagaceae bacterium]